MALLSFIYSAYDNLIFKFQTRKLKRLLETVFGWDFEDNAMGLIFEEDDEVFVASFLLNFCFLFCMTE